MRAEPEPASTEATTSTRWPYFIGVGLAALVGIALLVDSLLQSSAVYDEGTYLSVAADWWRTGDQHKITRMGSPLTFWKLQQAPLLCGLDRAGFRRVIEDPIGYQPALLPLARISSLWVWIVALLVTAAWSRRLYGPRAMVLAAWLFALSPNLLAHGPLVTMELPLLTCTTAMFFSFWEFLRSGKTRWFVLSAAVGGLGFSCKFTTVLVPPVLALAWWIDQLQSRKRGPIRSAAWIAGGMVAYLAIGLVANLLVTGFALLPLAHASGPHPSIDGRFGPMIGRWVNNALEMPIPQDLVGFATQMLQQRAGGASYLFGERRMTGWWYYYFVAIAVKVPLTFWALVVGRLAFGTRGISARKDLVLPLAIGVFLLATAVGSSRNYGVRYLLPIAPLAIIWVSVLAEKSRWAIALGIAGVLGQAVAVATIHPHELSYFNMAAGGPVGGRHILADSNLDWGQGLKALARLQEREPKYRDLTLYYFGDTETDPHVYGVVGRCYTIDAGIDHPDLPTSLKCESRYLAVSASLQWGPWGPADYFRPLNTQQPVRMTDDKTIAIYRVGVP